MVRLNFFKPLLAVIGLFSTPFVLYGQSNTYQADYPANLGPEEIQEVAKSKEGGYAFQTDQGGYVGKVNINGKFQWLDSIFYTGSDPAEIDINDIVRTETSSTGYSNYVVVGALHYNNISQTDIYLAKVSGQPGNEGDIIWDRAIKNDDGDHIKGRELTISQDSNGTRDGYVITGTATINGNYTEAVFMKVDLNGNFFNSGNNWYGHEGYFLGSEITNISIDRHFDPGNNRFGFTVAGTYSNGDGFVISRDLDGYVQFAEAYGSLSFSDLSIQDQGLTVASGTNVSSGQYFLMNFNSSAGGVNWYKEYQKAGIDGEILKDPGNNQIVALVDDSRSNGFHEIWMTVDLGNGNILKVNGFRDREDVDHLTLDNRHSSGARYVAGGIYSLNTSNGMELMKVDEGLNSACRNNFLSPFTVSGSAPDSEPLEIDEDEILDAQSNISESYLVNTQDPAICGDPSDSTGDGGGSGGSGCDSVNTFSADYPNHILDGELEMLIRTKDGGYLAGETGSQVAKLTYKGANQWRNDGLDYSSANVFINDMTRSFNSGSGNSNFILVGKIRYDGSTQEDLYIAKISGQPGSEGQVIWDRAYENPLGERVRATSVTPAKDLSGQINGYVISGHTGDRRYLVFMKVDLNGYKVTANDWNKDFYRINDLIYPHVFDFQEGPQVDRHFDPASNTFKYTVAGAYHNGDTSGFVFERDYQGTLITQRRYENLAFGDLSVKEKGLNTLAGKRNGDGESFVLSLNHNGSKNWYKEFPDYVQLKALYKDTANNQILTSAENHAINRDILTTFGASSGSLLNTKSYRSGDYFMDLLVDNKALTGTRYLVSGVNNEELLMKVDPNLYSACKDSALFLDLTTRDIGYFDRAEPVLDELVLSQENMTNANLLDSTAPLICGDTTLCPDSSCYADNSASEFYRVIEDSLDGSYHFRVEETDFYQGGDNGELIFADSRVHKGDSNMILCKMSEYGNVKWLKEYPWNMRNTGSSVIKVDDGYVISGIMFDSNSSVNKIFLMRTDLQGNQQWLRTYESQFYVSNTVVRQNLEGEFIVITNHNMRYTSENQGDTDDLVVMKTDQNGNLINYKRYSKGGRYYMNYHEALTLRNDNTVVVGDGGHAWDFSGGLFQLLDPNNDTIKDMHYRVQTPSGNYDLWGGPDERSNLNFRDVVRADNGNFILAGEYNNSDQYGESATFQNGVIVEIDASTYQVVWAKEYEINTNVFTDFANITIDGNSSDNGFIVSGYSGVENSIERSLVLKVDRRGSVQWSKRIGGNTDHRGYNAYALPGNNDVLLKGYIQDTSGGTVKPYLARLDNGTNTECIQDVGFEPSFITIDQLPYNSDEWTSNPTTRNPEFSRSSSCKPYLEACAAYPQRSRSSSNQVMNIGGSGKYTSERDSLAHTAEIEESASNAAEEVEVYPNPVQETLNLDFSDKPDQRLEAILSSLEGKQVMRQKVKGDRALDVSDLEAGVYLLELRSEAGRRLLIKKVVKGK